MVKLVYCDNIIVGGQAVYAARSLYETIEPTMYNDDTICGAIGISQKTETQNAATNSSFSIMPNPSNGMVSFVLNKAQDATILIYDALGKQVAQLSITKDATSTTANLQYLPTGIYFVKLQQADAILQTQKLTLIH